MPNSDQTQNPSSRHFIPEEKSQSHDDLPGLFLRRNIVFERLRLLSRVFSPERFTLILKALENEDE